MSENPLPSAFDLGTIFVHLADGGAAALLPVNDTFWENLDPRLEQGRMVSILPSDADWPNWEMHPDGDELIYLLSGSMTLILDLDGGHHRLPLTIGQAALVPRGIWHTADVATPGKALYVTPGAGTKGRPRTLA